MTSTSWLGDPRLPGLLATGELSVQGRLVDASNATLRCVIDVGGGLEIACVYKPVSGERPLWDFPDWTLTHRELAAFHLSQAAGWDLVPPTVWREDGPAGSGMCQLWIDEDPGAAQVTVSRGRRPRDGWLHVLDAEDGAGQPVQLIHSSVAELQRMALFDAMANNADRKGGHVLTDVDGRIWGIDHGVTFAVEEKLRTVLWGWAGEPVPDDLMSEVEALRATLGRAFDPVDRWLAEDERDALRVRVRRLAGQARFPLPPRHWPAVPWPVF